MSPRSGFAIDDGLADFRSPFREVARQSLGRANADRGDEAPSARDAGGGLY